MAVRYLIVKHLSLGFGILLKRDQDGLGKIFFADTKSSKTVTLSHPSLSVAEGITLSKFVNSGLYEGLFTDEDKKKAEPYLNNRIKNMHLSENECYGAIIGTHEYSFRITIDSNAFITLSCSCPTEGICKHLYAVFVNIKKLIDPRGQSAVTPSASGSEFKDILERFLYVRGGDNIALLGNINYQIRSLEKCSRFLEDAYSFYQRSQYKARMISDVLGPLYFNEHNVANFNKIKENASEQTKTMLEDAEAQFELLKNEYEKRSGETRKANLYHIILTPDCLALSALLKHAESNYSEERPACRLMAEFLKYQDLTIDDIIVLKSTYLFQVNHRYYMSDILNSPAKNRLSTYLLFFDELPFEEGKIKQIPLEYFLKVAQFSDDKSHYIQIVHRYFDELKEEEYTLLAELLIGVSLQHDFVDERTIRLSIELSKKIPSNYFINELVENNIRRPKKARVR